MSSQYLRAILRSHLGPDDGGVILVQPVCSLHEAISLVDLRRVVQVLRVWAGGGNTSTRNT